MGGLHAGPNNRTGSAVLEMCLWSVLIVLILSGFHQKSQKCYRGFKKAIKEQASPIRPLWDREKGSSFS